MKSIKKNFFYILVALFAIACDQIDGPYMEGTQHHDSNEDSTFQQVVLLEEFTGHQCSNCPAAANIAAQLHTLYGKRFIVIAYHSGWFARVSQNFPTDYTTPISDELYAHFGVQSNPAGVINRENNAGYVVNSADWGAKSALLLEQEPVVTVRAEAQYQPSNRNITLNVDIKALSNIDEPIWVCAYVTESGLISPQETPEGVIANYEHKHVFRQSLNGTWGSVVSESLVNAQVKNVTISGTLNQDIVAEHCEVVIFVYNKVNGRVLSAVAVDM